MAKQKENETIKKTGADSVQAEEKVQDQGQAKKEAKASKKEEKKAEKHAEELAKKDEEIAALKDQLMRSMAEFDNYRKRTLKEKEAVRESAVSKTVEDLLPIMDNLARATAVSKDSDVETVLQGVEMIQKAIQDVFEKLDVKPIEALGKEFDPEYHNAVMHVDDENAGENEIVEEFVRGYMLGEKVLRHSVVKVAN